MTNSIKEKPNKKKNIEIKDDSSKKVVAEKKDSHLNQNIKRLEGEIADIQEKYRYLAAEKENEKKAYQSQLQEIYKYSNERIIREIILVIDDWERAMQFGTKSESPEVKNFLTGFQILLKQMQEILRKEGLEEIKIIPQKDKYNNKTQEAVEVVEDKNYPSEVVLEILQKGYLLNKKLLRSAKVKVNKIK